LTHTSDDKMSDLTILISHKFSHTSIRIYAYGDFIIELVLRHRDTFYHCEILSSSCALPLCAVCNLFRATSKSSLSVPLDMRRNFSLFAADLSASDSVYI